MTAPKAAMRTTLTYTEQSFVDASQQEMALPGWDQRYTQLSRGQFSGSIKSVALGGVTLTYERLNATVAQVTAPPPDKFMIGMRFDQAEDRVNGVSCSTSGLIHVGGEPIHLVSDDNAHGIGLTIDKSVVPEFDMDGRGALISISQYTGLAEFRRWLQSIMTIVPDRLGPEDNGMSEVLPEYLRDRVAEICATIDPDARPFLRQNFAYTVFCKSTAYLDENPEANLSVCHVATAIKQPEHVLRSAFLQVTGLSPRVWLRTRRLNTARRALLDRVEAHKGVAQIAMENGFYHLGRFAAYYTETFGEMPLATIRATLGAA